MSKRISKKPSGDDTDWYPTDEEFAAFRPIAEVDPDLLAAHQAGTLKKRGRPPLAQKKEVVSLRLDAEILAAFKAKGRGWQTELNKFLRHAVEEKRI